MSIADVVLPGKDEKTFVELLAVFLREYPVEYSENFFNIILICLIGSEIFDDKGIGQKIQIIEFLQELEKLLQNSYQDKEIRAMSAFQKAQQY